MTKAELKDLKIATQKLTRWDSSNTAFGHFQVVEPKATTSKNADRIYEFFCLMKLLTDLHTHYQILLVAGNPAGKIFPQAPANKKGWPYFKITNKKDGHSYQVCYGTTIKLISSPKTSIAPDISIQVGTSTDDPDESMVELVMDAKFKYKSNQSMPIAQIHAFIQIVSALKTIKASAMTLEFDRLVDLKANCLLTNGKGLDDHRKYCMDFYIKQVERFDLAGIYNAIG
jgi:hypothetical protein